jgi:FAD/FMN-containing dehydrogenase
MIDPALINRFKELVGPLGAIDGANPDAAAYTREWRDRWPGQTPLILRPKTSAEVSKILALAQDTGTAIVPQGGNTGLVGGQMPIGQDQLILSLGRMNAIRQIDPLAQTIVAEAGVTLAAVQQAADQADRLFPLSLASEGSATIGGLIATNAGGTAVLRYGNMRQLVLGLEVVLADGRIIERLSALRKDNTGLDLKHLFIGTEGLHGIITAASLSLHPKPRDIKTAFVALTRVGDALALLAQAQNAAGGSVSGFELIPAIGLQFIKTHRPDMRVPFTHDHPWYVLIEMTSGDPPEPFGQTQSPLGQTQSPLGQTIADCLTRALGEGLIEDAVIAQDMAQHHQFWAIREGLSEIQKYEGGSIKHDVSLPISRLAEFIAKASQAVEAFCPGCRPVPFGHLGDGNVHFNVSQPIGADSAQYLALWPEMNRIVHDLVVEMGGSISAEHGIGQAKIDDLYRYTDPTELELMARIKHALDPRGILNPGKILMNRA